MEAERREPESSGSKGIVYCLINDSMPGLVKIGSTTDIESRLKTLDTTGVPEPFKCVTALYVENARQVEKQLHFVFNDRRVRKSREFFEVNPLQVVTAILLTGGKPVTLEDPSDPDADESRRPAFKFDMVGLEVGAEIYFKPDGGPAITAEVASSDRILFRGEVTSLSASATEVQQERGKALNSGVAGTDYWMFGDETLADRRVRMEREEKRDFDSSDFDPKDFG